jgi:hypothetical protein
LVYLLLAPFVVLLGVLALGVLFDRWYKDPLLILEYSAYAYLVLLGIRLLPWLISGLGR